MTAPSAWTIQAVMAIANALAARFAAAQESPDAK